jgi:type II secretory pathway pseudopilin PulG
VKSRVNAFTLVELLLALAITSILIVLLVNVVSATLSVWAQGRNQIDTFAIARQTLGRIADEIQGASAAANQMEFSENLTVTPFVTGGPSPTPNPQPTPQRTKSENVFFVAPYPNSTAGDLCVIAYRHIDIDQNPQPNNSHTLQRAFLNSQSAWNGGALTRYRSNGYPTLDWRTIARGVLEFEIQSYSQYELDNNKAPVASWNSVTGADPSDPNYDASDNTILGNTPRRVVLRLKVVDEKTLERLNAVPFGGSIYNQIVSRSAREFTAGISLPSAH